MLHQDAQLVWYSDQFSPRPDGYLHLPVPHSASDGQISHFEIPYFIPNDVQFVLCDATQSAERVMPQPQYVVRPSVCLSATFRYRDHIGSNTSKIISSSFMAD